MCTSVIQSIHTSMKRKKINYQFLNIMCTMMKDGETCWGDHAAFKTRCNDDKYILKKGLLEASKLNAT